MKVEPEARKLFQSVNCSINGENPNLHPHVTFELVRQKFPKCFPLRKVSHKLVAQVGRFGEDGLIKRPSFLSPTVFQVFEDMVWLKLPQLPQDALAGEDRDTMATGATHLDMRHLCVFLKWAALLHEGNTSTCAALHRSDGTQQELSVAIQFSVSGE